jgi:hypothetical protein
MKDSVRLLGISISNLNTEVRKAIVSVQLRFDFNCAFVQQSLNFVRSCFVLITFDENNRKDGLLPIRRSCC